MNYTGIISRKLYLKYSKDTNNYYNIIMINNLLKIKPSHILISFRETLLYEFQEEFLKKYYTIKESKKHIPKFVEYYRNYILFFSKPIFRNLKLGKLLLLAGEKCAQNYYDRNYGDDNLNENNIKIKYTSSIKNIFSDTVIESINGVCSLSFSNNSTHSKSINLNQSSFRFKKIYDNESSSFVDLLNVLNGKENISNKFNNKIRLKKNCKIKINEETRKKIMGNILINKEKKNIIKSPLIIDKQISINKKIMNKRENSLNLNSKKIENSTRNSNLIYNYKTDISNKAKTKIKIINNKSKINKKKTNTMSLDFDNNKNKLNNKLIIQNYNDINYKSKKRNSTSYRINSLNRLNSNNTRNIEFQKIMTTSFNKFNNQQKLFNQNKNNKIMISCNISKRNKTYFSPEIRHYQNLTLNNKIKK